MFGLIIEKDNFKVLNIFIKMQLKSTLNKNVFIVIIANKYTTKFSVQLVLKNKRYFYAEYVKVVNSIFFHQK